MSIRSAFLAGVLTVGLVVSSVLHADEPPRDWSMAVVLSLVSESRDGMTSKDATNLGIEGSRTLLPDAGLGLQLTYSTSIDDGSDAFYAAGEVFSKNSWEARLLSTSLYYQMRGDFYARPKLGVVRRWATVNDAAGQKAETGETELMYGMGFGLRVFRRSALELDYSSLDSHLASYSLVWRTEF